MSSWLAPAPSTRTRILHRTGPGPAAGRSQHLLVIGERVRPGLPGPQQHGQALAGISEPGPSGWKPLLFFQMGTAPSLSECGATSVAFMLMTSQQTVCDPERRLIRPGCSLRIAGW